MEGNSTSNATSLMTMIMQDSGITKDPNNAGEVSFRYSINAIRMSFLPLIVVGTVTNVLNLAVFTRPKMKSLSTTVYLLALSVADLGVMYFELFRIWFEWMDKMVDPALYMTDTYCKLGNYLNVACRDFSNWLIAAITVERLIVLAAPLKAKLFCTVFRARIITVSMACLIFGAHVHFLIFSAALEDVGWVCWQNPTSAIAPVITAWIEFIFGNTVVFFVLLTNVAIVVLIVRQSGNIQSNKDDRMDQTKKLTGMLLAIGVLFLVCELPRVIMAVIFKYLPKTYTPRILMNLTFVISGINHSCNFFIYVISGQRFRQVLSEMFGCLQGPSDLSRSTPSLATQVSQTSGAEPNNHA